ncbi:MAG TPA: TfoX/Sxy family protein [Polyangiaceae bacterium]|nr:TfoX/Sxy family protein [Polyangiaceae bacterium]
MAYDEQLAERVRAILAAARRDVTEKRLMGTLAFLVDGSLCCSVGRDGLLIRVLAEEREQLLAEPFVSPMRLGVRTMKGFVRVAGEGLPTRARIAKWIGRGIAAAQARPKKGPTRRGASSKAARQRRA